MLLRTHSGRFIDFENPDPAAIDPLDIAVALSRKCRWGGHTARPFYVAQHCVLVAHECRREAPAIRLAALLHDATEAYLEDLPRPAKRLLPGYRDLERRLAAAIERRFALPGLLTELPPVVKAADDCLLATEARDLWGAGPIAWQIQAEPRAAWIETWSSDRAYAAFLNEFDRLNLMHRPGAHATAAACAAAIAGNR